MTECPAGLALLGRSATAGRRREEPGGVLRPGADVMAPLRGGHRHLAGGPTWPVSGDAAAPGCRGSIAAARRRRSFRNLPRLNSLLKLMLLDLRGEADETRWARIPPNQPHVPPRPATAPPPRGRQGHQAAVANDSARSATATRRSLLARLRPRLRRSPATVCAAHGRLLHRRRHRCLADRGVCGPSRADRFVVDAGFGRRLAGQRCRLRAPLLKLPPSAPSE